jgi:hypothetical protein
MLILCSGLGGMASAGGDAANISIDATGLSAAASVSDTTSMRLTVSDPYGATIFQGRSHGSAITWSLPATAPDGYYTYEILINAGSKVSRDWGRVKVQGGVILDSTQRKGRRLRSGFLEHFGSIFTAAVVKVVDALVPTAVAAPISGNHIAGDGTVGGWFGINHSDGEAPEYHLHVQGDEVEPNPFLGFENFSGTDFWDMGTFFGVFFIEHEAAGTEPFNIGFGIGFGAPTLSFFIEDFTGDVGLGTAVPSSPLHVLRQNGTAKILAEETNAAVAPRAMFELINNGPIGFNMTDTNVAQTWRFAAQPAGFRVSLDGTGGPEVEVGPAGTLQVGPGGSANLFLDAAGNLTVVGTATATAHLTASDRNLKENFVALEGGQVLAKITALPVTEWSFKGDPVRHIGPTAQDFKTAFGLGPDDTHIATLDLASVAVVGVKALHKMIEAREATITQQQAEIAELRQRLGMLEGVVSDIVAQQITQTAQR